MPRPRSIRVRRSAALACALLAVAGCVQPTPYQPSDGTYGYTEQRIEENRYRLGYRASPATAVETVEFYLLYRAAEVTLATGHDWFRVVAPAIDGPAGAGEAGDPGLGPVPEGRGVRAGKARSAPRKGTAPRGQGRYRPRRGPAAREGPVDRRAAPAPGATERRVLRRKWRGHARPHRPSQRYRRSGHVRYSLHFGVPIHYRYPYAGPWSHWYGWYGWYGWPHPHAYAPPPRPASPPVHAAIEILVFRGAKPAGAADAYDARSVRAELAPRVGAVPSDEALGSPAPPD